MDWTKKNKKKHLTKPIINTGFVTKPKAQRFKTRPPNLYDLAL